MNILYIVSRSIEINTSASIRNIATIDGFVQCGCNVTLITSEPDKNHPAYDPIRMGNVNTIQLGTRGMEGLARIGRKYKFLMPIKASIGRIIKKKMIYDNYISLTKQITDVSICLDDYDYVISSSDPKSSHLVAEELLKKNRNTFRGKWIQIWGDPFLGDISSNNQNRNKIKREEERLISLADEVIYVSSMTCAEQKRRFSNYSYKIRYIPIPYAKEHIYHKRDIRTVDIVNLLYCGDYTSSIRDILPLYNSINSMNDFHLTICGGSDISLQSTEKVTVLPRISYKEVMMLEEKADILIHLSNKSGTQIPGKIYQYAGTNKPIVFILDGEKELLRRIYEQYNRFYFSDNEVDSITKTLGEIKKSDGLALNIQPLEAFSSKAVASSILGLGVRRIEQTS